MLVTRKKVGITTGVLLLTIILVGAIGESLGWTTTQHQAVVQYILAMLATLAGAAAIWYTIETVGLRNQAEEQLRFLDQQARLSLIPFLSCTIFSRADIARFENVPNDRTIVMDAIGTTAGRIQLQIQIFKDKLRSRQHAWMNEQIRLKGALGPQEFEYAPYVVVVDNPTDKIAQMIWVIAYDSDTQTYTASSSFSDYIGPSEADLIEVNDQQLTFDDLRERHEKLYKRTIQWANELRTEDRSFFALLFLTFDGTACMVKRQFVRQTDGSLRNVASTFYW